jgi:hypothetical protein
VRCAYASHTITIYYFFHALFEDAFNIENMQLRTMVQLMNDELEQIKKTVGRGQIEVLYQHIHGGAQ